MMDWQKLSKVAASTSLVAVLLAGCAPPPTQSKPSDAPKAAAPAPAPAAAPAPAPAASPAAAAPAAPAASPAVGAPAAPAASPAAAPKPAAAASPVATLPANFQPITLKAAEQLPPTGLASEEIKWFADELSRRTDGKVKIQFFWSESLAKAADMVPALQNGIADIGAIPSTYDPARTANFTVVDMPYNATDYWCGIKASFELFETDPGLVAEFERNGFKPLVGYSSGFFHVVSKEPITKVSELQGKRIRVYGGAQVAWMKNIGVNAIFMNYNDIYEAMQRGTVDGALGTLYLTDAWKHYEVAGHMTLMKNGFVVGAPQMSISTRVWNTFPESLKQIFKEVAYEHNWRYARDQMELETNLRKKFEGQGMKFYEFSAEDERTLAESGQKANEAWIQEIAGRGAPAQQTWDNLQKLNKACMDELSSKGYPWAPK